MKTSLIRLFMTLALTGAYDLDQSTTPEAVNTSKLSSMSTLQLGRWCCSVQQDGVLQGAARCLGKKRRQKSAPSCSPEATALRVTGVMGAPTPPTLTEHCLAQPQMTVTMTLTGAVKGNGGSPILAPSSTQPIASQRPSKPTYFSIATLPFYNPFSRYTQEPQLLREPTASTIFILDTSIYRIRVCPRKMSRPRIYCREPLPTVTDKERIKWRIASKTVRNM